MKRYLVGMLAVFSLSGCGLEMGEALGENGELVVGTSEGALLGQNVPAWPGYPSGESDGGTLGGAQLYATGAAPRGVTPMSYGQRALPQDPVPVKPDGSAQPGSGTPPW